MEYVVIFEEDENGCSAYVPDLPGCVAAGDTDELPYYEQAVLGTASTARSYGRRRRFRQTFVKAGH